MHPFNQLFFLNTKKLSGRVSCITLIDEKEKFAKQYNFENANFNSIFPNIPPNIVRKTEGDKGGKYCTDIIFIENKSRYCIVLNKKVRVLRVLYVQEVSTQFI